MFCARNVPSGEERGETDVFAGYSWVARDVTKNQTKKLSILLSFYFHEVLQYLNIFFGAKGLFDLRERTLEFPGFCVTRHLAGGQESSYVG